MVPDSCALMGTGPPYKLSERVSRLTPISQEEVERVLAGLNLGVQPGLDPDAGNVVAVGTFGYTAPQSPPQQVRHTHASHGCGSWL